MIKFLVGVAVGVANAYYVLRYNTPLAYDEK